MDAVKTLPRSVDRRNMPDNAGSAAERCLGLIAYGMHQRELGDTMRAARALAGALLVAQGLPKIPGQGEPLRALALYHLSRLELQRGPEHAEPARQMRDQAGGLLAPDHGCAQLPPPLVPLFQELMANVLVNLGEHSRAIPYCEASLQNLGDTESPAATAWTLWRAGKAHLNIGLRDHAAIPLRAAVKIYRTLAGDPRLTAILIDLGAALSKSAPAEAERCYEEAAEIHISKAQFESATSAWTNLGVMCTKQGRYAEALAYYEKALHVREHAPGTPAARIGILHNNIANVHRHMKNFDQAFRSVDRALALLEASAGHTLACAYGTRGLIFRDQGRDQEAVECFRKSSAEHRQQASPNLDTLSEELENEAAALTRLGREAEAAPPAPLPSLARAPSKKVPF
jgi:tetratricopeptide (TPR) repeat protein